MGFQGGALRGGEEGEGECCVGVQRKSVDGGRVFMHSAKGLGRI